MRYNLKRSQKNHLKFVHIHLYLLILIFSSIFERPRRVKITRVWAKQWDLRQLLLDLDWLLLSIVYCNNGEENKRRYNLMVCRYYQKHFIRVYIIIDFYILSSFDFTINFILIFLFNWYFGSSLICSSCLL